MAFGCLYRIFTLCGIDITGRLPKIQICGYRNFPMLQVYFSTESWSALRDDSTVEFNRAPPARRSQPWRRFPLYKSHASRTNLALFGPHDIWILIQTGGNRHFRLGFYTLKHSTFQRSAPRSTTQPWRPIRASDDSIMWIPAVAFSVQCEISFRACPASLNRLFSTLWDTVMLSETHPRPALSYTPGV
jgi:hypothetical protein